MENNTDKYKLKKFPYRINWEITQQCNFNCTYCSNAATVNKIPPPPVYTPHQLSEFFERTGKNWLILITGGEPFLYPNFVDVCYELSKKHHLQITTNLSSPKIIEFADKINPDRIFNINASYHREIRTDSEKDTQFILKCKLLKDKGFNVIINLIAFPPLLNTINEDFYRFTDFGFDTIVYLFRGEYNNMKYPNSYTSEELMNLNKLNSDFYDIEKYPFEQNNYGHLCEAGSNYFGLKQNGDLVRCFSLNKKIGNLFTDFEHPEFKIKPCIALKCHDGWFGAASVTNKKANFLRIYKEKKRYNKLNYGE